MKILLVDDMESIRNLYKLILGTSKYEFFEAENGLEAYNICVKEKPDLIFSDFDMPEYDGAWLDERLFNEGKKIPIVLVTSTYRDIFKEMLKRNTVKILYKPFSINELNDVLDRIKNRKNG